MDLELYILNPRNSARLVGVLFLTAMVSGGLRYFLLDPILDSSNYLVNVSANENLVIIGTLSFFILAVALIGISIAIYPILKKYNEALALGYVAARIVESVLFIVSIIAILTLFQLSQEFVNAGAPDISYFQTLCDLLLAVRYYAYNVLWPITLSLGALMFYYILYQSRLIPRWLSIWGFIAAPLFPVSWLSLFGSVLSVFFIFPLVVNELVLEIWLIVKGFNL
ncbi:MAG: DUF4386 domain-containing protein, partial [Candidatus Kariarchaeaceae archaeon]